MKNIHDMRASGLTKYFYKLAEQSQDVFWIKSTDYKEQIYISPAFENSWGITCQNLYDDPSLWITAMHPEDRERLQHDCSNRVGPPRMGETIEKNYRIIRPDGTMRWIKDTSFGLFDENNECFAFAGICKDVSKDVMHSQELLNEKLSAEMANQAKSDFLAKMSHDFRTPLNAILGITHIMSTKELSKEFKEYISLISQASNNLLSLVTDILDFAKVEIGALSFTSDPIDLHLLISQVMHSFKFQAKEANIALNLNYADNVARFVIGDAKRIRQILTNLISNSLKFTSQGSIEVLVDCHKQLSNQTEFVIAVQDTGIGIPEKDFGYIFEKFGQLESMHHRKHQGSGLGLSIVKQLVEKLGGTITVKSKVGDGSEFIVTLPLQLQESSAEKTTIAMNDYTNKAIEQKKLNLNLLLVEDNPVNQVVITKMLQEMGCQVDIAGDGKQTIALLAKGRQYDAIMMDIGLPDIDGFEMAALIRQKVHLNKIPIIAMTAHVMESDQKKCFTVGMNDVITKPIPYEQLHQTLQMHTHNKVSI
ncbi:MAG: hypothetical protein A3F14_03170 [Gammaproteobacteria bacterium RIFCSPHIGHO2_12_FULL_43_28]|nr:MAG: hypothetical protein A3F14_03170 [Gammaproteobacteria bacterium RIFCSPHIGHO2_12_FULL_43_28]